MPETGTTRNLLNKFKEIQHSGSNSPASPRLKKEFTPPPQSGVYENTPTKGIVYEERVAESGILENNPERREGVAREEEPSAGTVEFPERGYAKNMVSKWKQLKPSTANQLLLLQDTRNSPRPEKSPESRVPSVPSPQQEPTAVFIPETCPDSTKNNRHQEYMRMTRVTVTTSPGRKTRIGSRACPGREPASHSSASSKTCRMRPRSPKKCPSPSPEGIQKCQLIYVNECLGDILIISQTEDMISDFYLTSTASSSAENGFFPRQRTPSVC